MQDFIKRVPIPTSGLALGLAALGNLLQPSADEIRIVCGLLATALIALVSIKSLLYPHMLREDMQNPVLASVSATFMMTLMQLSCYIAPTSQILGAILWLLAVSAHLTLMICFSIRFSRNFKLDQVFPTYFICYVGIIVASVTSPQFGFEPFAYALFWFGFACFIPLFILITIRYAKHPAPEATRPLFCIYSAPASLSIVGYLAVEPTPNLLFVACLLIAAQILFIIVLARLPKLLALDFYPSFAAMTFPFVITATALTCSIDLFRSANITLSPIIEQISALEIIFASAMVVFVFAKYMQFFFAPVARKVTEKIVIEAEPAE